MGLLISPAGVVDEEVELRVRHDLTFGSRVIIREIRGPGKKEAFLEPGGRSANADTD